MIYHQKFDSRNKYFLIFLITIRSQKLHGKIKNLWFKQNKDKAQSNQLVKVANFTNVNTND